MGLEPSTNDAVALDGEPWALCCDWQPFFITVRFFPFLFRDIVIMLNALIDVFTFAFVADESGYEAWYTSLFTEMSIAEIWWGNITLHDHSSVKLLIIFCNYRTVTSYSKSGTLHFIYFQVNKVFVSQRCHRLHSHSGHVWSSVLFTHNPDLNFWKQISGNCIEKLKELIFSFFKLVLDPIYRICSHRFCHINVDFKGIKACPNLMFASLSAIYSIDQLLRAE